MSECADWHEGVVRSGRFICDSCEPGHGVEYVRFVTLVDEDDDEAFCPTCLAGVESSQHLTAPCGDGDR